MIRSNKNTTSPLENKLPPIPNNNYIIVSFPKKDGDDCRNQ